jgi:hypothetical protein
MVVVVPVPVLVVVEVVVEVEVEVLLVVDFLVGADTKRNIKLSKYHQMK